MTEARDDHGAAATTRVLGEVRLADADEDFLTGLRRWLEVPLRGCAPAAVHETCVVLGELLGNAFRHARPPFDLRLTLPRPGTVVRIEVHDAAATPAAGWPLGRGLLVVRDLCPDWGVERTPTGKAVWAELPVPVALGTTGGG